MIEWTSYSNPVAHDPDNIAITVTLDTVQFGPIPFTAHRDDPEEHGRRLHAEILANASQIPIKPHPPAESEMKVLA